MHSYQYESSNIFDSTILRFFFLGGGERTILLRNALSWRIVLFHWFDYCARRNGRRNFYRDRIFRKRNTVQVMMINRKMISAEKWTLDKLSISSGPPIVEWLAPWFLIQRLLYIRIASWACVLGRNLLLGSRSQWY